MATMGPHLHILLFVVVNWAASVIVCILQPYPNVVILLLCFVLEHSFKPLVQFDSIYGGLRWAVLTFVYYRPHVRGHILGRRGRQWLAGRAMKNRVLLEHTF